MSALRFLGDEGAVRYISVRRLTAFWQSKITTQVRYQFHGDSLILQAEVCMERQIGLNVAFLISDNRLPISEVRFSDVHCLILKIKWISDLTSRSLKGPPPREQGSKSTYYAQGHDHVALMGKWPWHCTSTGKMVPVNLFWSETAHL